MKNTRLDKFVAAALEALIFTGTTDDDIPLDHEGYTVDDFDAESQVRVNREAIAFLAAIEHLDLDHVDPEQLGHDFILHGQNTGVGFYDRDYYTAEQKAELDRIMESQFPQIEHYYVVYANESSLYYGH